MTIIVDVKSEKAAKELLNIVRSFITENLDLENEDFIAAIVEPEY